MSRNTKEPINIKLIHVIWRRKKKRVPTQPMKLQCIRLHLPQVIRRMCHGMDLPKNAPHTFGRFGIAYLQECSHFENAGHSWARNLKLFRWDGLQD